MSNNIKVFINKTDSGSLSLENEQYVFNYKESAKDVVSLTMPIRSASWNSKKLHPIFQMNMPEGALKETIINHFSKIQTMDDINLLKLIGPYMLGRVKFEKVPNIDESLKLDDILNTSSKNLFDELLERFAIRSGVSGVQPKLLLQAHDKTTMKFEHFIVKSWEKNYPNLALNEYFCMKACNYSGLPTPEFYISDDFTMFVMKRFDINNDKYLGFEDMCVLTARGTEQKYDGSYEECVRVIKDIISPTKRKESLKIFFKAIIMNHLLKNGDGHLKNYGILYQNDFEDSYLAPIYDVITTTIYLKNDIPALRLSDGKLWWKEKTYKAFAKLSCGLSNSEYTSILNECKDAIIKTKKEIKQFQQIQPDVKEFLEDLILCWSETI
ncbi:phosphatidylinositol kinase [Halarcobacter mediterraneus]|uniref:Phosphatidylinositol kinase n=1 Tax=Halarcobacter mediterraneus TaxID=2023153 RepID=A0A4Q1B154_9BACT|nr:type II toxin-antitoxin system HipA family toxin [Halarcobacter mediterraneus]RXK14051.1 phosphatidylinositol kinase [Halarcobacter mediterraneus]